MAKLETTENDAPESSAGSVPSPEPSGELSSSDTPDLSPLPAPPVGLRDYGALRAAWSRLWETDAPVLPLRLDPAGPWPKVQRFSRAFLTSSLLHSAIVFFFYSVPIAIFLAWLLGTPVAKPSVPMQVVVVDMRHMNLADFLPKMGPPPGPGKGSAKAAEAGSPPGRGAVHYDPRVTIASNPAAADNFRVTIRTPKPPPGLKPPPEVKVPDLIFSGANPLLFPQLPAAPPEKVKAPAKPEVVIPVIPPVQVRITPPPAPPPLKLAMQTPDTATPHLVVPPPPPVKNALPPDIVAPPTKHPSTTVQLADATPKPAPVRPKAAEPEAPRKETVPSPPTPGPSTAKPSSEAPTPSDEGPEILSLSIDPTPLKDIATIPAGVRGGAFSISPGGDPRSHANGPPGGALAGPGTGQGGLGSGVGKGEGQGGKGDKTGGGGVGSGNPGPGGGGNGGPGTTPGGGSKSPANPTSSASNPPKPAVGPTGPESVTPAVSVSGPGVEPGIASGTLAPLNPDDLVYEVKPDMLKRRAPGFMVSSGAEGGGGLRIYGVLHSSSIYTVYFSMPGKSWILEYCAQEGAAKVDDATGTVQLHMGATVVTPSAIDQFDFHRPATSDSSSGVIILHGVIRQNGTVGDLSLVQGTDSTTNAAAMAAFSRWKFKPPLRGSSPVSLEILVGIR